MITLPVPAYDINDLARKPLDSSEEILTHLKNGVEAYAKQYDPLARLRGFNDRESTATRLTIACGWLAQYAPLEPAGESLSLHGRDYDPYLAWQKNISTLGRKHIRANYQQGREGGHPVFTLKFVPILKEADEKGGHQSLALQEHHWSLFVKAVQTQNWLNFADKLLEGRANVDLETYEDCWASVWGTLQRLALRYPALGEPNAGTDRFTLLCSRPEDSTELWEENVRAAAASFAIFHHN